MERRAWVDGKLCAAAAFQDLSILEDHNFVDALDGAQAVGDNNRCAICQKLVNRACDQPLGGRIEVSRSLIENDKAGVSEGDASKYEQLGLTHRKASVASLQVCIQPVR